MKYANTAFTLAALAIPAVHAQGTAAVVNMCEFPAYIWSVGDEASPMVALPNQTVGYQESYRQKADKSGISIKIAPSFLPIDNTDGGNMDTSANITQFEYTISPGTVWYDISYVNGNAFQGVPVLLQPSDLSCPNVTCAATDSVCQAVYNNPNDNAATHACGADADLFFLLCPPNNDGSSTPPSSSASSSTGSTNGVENVVVDANGNVQLAPAPSTQTTDKEVTQPDIGALTSIDAFSNLVTDWKTLPGQSTKRDEIATRHSHKDLHSRRNRIRRHSHD